MPNKEHTYGELKFAELLDAKGVVYTQQAKIVRHNVVFCRPDFYIPDKALYIEVVSNKQTLTPRRYNKFRVLIKEGYNITFYHHSGKKLVFTDLALGRLGVTSNKDLPTLTELEA